jgi:hypothetical protein
MTLDTWLDIQPKDITAAIIAAVLVGVAGTSFAWFWRRALGWVSSLNDRWSLRWNRKELERFRTLHVNAAALPRFLLQQVLWVLTLLGIAIMFAPLGHDALGIKLLYVIRFALGGLMYLIGVYALGTAHHLTHQPERTMQKLEDRIRELEGRRANVIRPTA